jgi:hypothetical protein
MEARRHGSMEEFKVQKAKFKVEEEKLLNE